MVQKQPNNGKTGEVPQEFPTVAPDEIRAAFEVGKYARDGKLYKGD